MLLERTPLHPHGPLSVYRTHRYNDAKTDMSMCTRKYIRTARLSVQSGFNIGVLHTTKIDKPVLKYPTKTTEPVTVKVNRKAGSAGKEIK